MTGYEIFGTIKMDRESKTMKLLDLLCAMILNAKSIA